MRIEGRDSRREKYLICPQNWDRGEVGRTGPSTKKKQKQKRKENTATLLKTYYIFYTCIINSMSMTKDNLLYFLDVIKFLGSAILQESTFPCCIKEKLN